MLTTRRTQAQWNFSLLPYGDLWRRKRKLLHSHIHQGVADRYDSIQVASARRFAREILTVLPMEKALPRAIRLNIGQTIIKIVYGFDAESYEDDYIALPEKVFQDTIKVLSPGQFFVDAIPIRELSVRKNVWPRLINRLVKYVPVWFPGASFQRLVQDIQVTQRRMLNTPIDSVRALMVRNSYLSGSHPFTDPRRRLREKLRRQWRTRCSKKTRRFRLTNPNSR
jgi:hypothetical protein